MKSTDDFIDLLRSTRTEGLISSLDAESLFKNVPVETRIEIILKNVYEHPTLNWLDIPRNIFAQLLRSCTTQAPFISPDGNLYLQIEGVAMGSPLGPTFANFHMGNLGQSVLRDQNIKPNIYYQYVDDIFVVRNKDHLKQLQERMQSSSVLSFTYEISINGKIPFLDVNIKTQHGQFVSDVYKKTTNDGKLLNAKSECPARYKSSVIVGGIQRAHKICSSELI